MSKQLLFTPGPLTTSEAVKGAMLRDVGSRDSEFLEVVRRIRAKLLALAGGSQRSGYEAVLIQGSGTYAVEAALSSVVPAGGSLLLLVNGAYGERMAQIAARHGIPHEAMRWPETEPVSVQKVAARLAQDPRPTHVAVVHCETSTGILNRVSELGRLCRAAGVCFIVDAMSSFGALPLDLQNDRIDFLISSANKCLQGVPGFAFVLARHAELERSAGCARTLSLDLHAQWKGLELSGQFRFTPPTHALLAFAKALEELEQEGGIPARGLRYARNHQALVAGMAEMGFVPILDPAHQSPIITAFHYPGAPQFRFDDFYERLSRRGMVIYPGKQSNIDSFRLGNIGHLFVEDIQALLAAIRIVLQEMALPIPVPQPLIWA